MSKNDQAVIDPRRVDGIPQTCHNVKFSPQFEGNVAEAHVITQSTLSLLISKNSDIIVRVLVPVWIGAYATL